MSDYFYPEELTSRTVNNSRYSAEIALKRRDGNCGRSLVVTIEIKHKRTKEVYYRGRISNDASPDEMDNYENTAQQIIDDYLTQYNNARS